MTGTAILVILSIKPVHPPGVAAGWTAAKPQPVAARRHCGRQLIHPIVINIWFFPLPDYLSQPLVAYSTSQACPYMNVIPTDKAPCVNPRDFAVFANYPCDLRTLTDIDQIG